MPLLDRNTLVDRPVLVNRGNEEDEQVTQETEDATVEVLGEGEGPTLHQLEFEPGDYNVVAGANTAAVLSTGQEDGQAFENAFINAAIQLKDLQHNDEDIRDIARFGLEKGVAEIGLEMEQIQTLRETEPEEPEDLGEEEVDSDGDSENESEDSEIENGESEEDIDIEDVEDDIENIKQEEDA